MDESEATRTSLMERFEERKTKNEGREQRNNADAYAGAPMVYYCLACGGFESASRVSQRVVQVLEALQQLPPTD